MYRCRNVSFAGAALWISACLVALLLSPATTWSAEVVYEEDDGVYTADAMLGGSNFEAFGAQPSLSPDGTKITFVESGGQPWWPSRSIFMKDLLTGDTTTLYQAPVTGGQQQGAVNHPRFSPDGEWIVFTYYIDYTPTDPDEGDAAIYKIRTDGTGMTQILNWAGDQQWASFSADGSKIVFLSTNRQNGIPVADWGT